MKPIQPSPLNILLNHHSRNRSKDILRIQNNLRRMIRLKCRGNLGHMGAQTVIRSQNVEAHFS